jgi:hypothetical protein
VATTSGRWPGNAHPDRMLLSERRPGGGGGGHNSVLYVLAPNDCLTGLTINNDGSQRALWGEPLESGARRAKVEFKRKPRMQPGKSLLGVLDNSWS